MKTSMNNLQISNIWIQSSSFSNTEIKNGQIYESVFVDTNLSNADLNGTAILEPALFGDNNFECKNNRICE